METTLIKKKEQGESVSERPLLQVLLEYQSANPQNYISEKDVNNIARELKLSRSRVYSTASFYSEISLSPRGRHVIRICCNAPCENAGKAEIERAIGTELNISVNETTGDGEFTLESVNCLGACYMSPAMKIDDEIYGNLTAAEAVNIIRGIRENEKSE